MEVKLTYFKYTGKFYSSGKYSTQKENLFEIWDEVRELKSNSNLPGVGSKEYIVSVDVPEHPHNHPHLIIN